MPTLRQIIKEELSKVRKVILNEAHEPLGYEIGEDIIDITVNNAHYKCVKTQSPVDLDSGKLSYIVYDETGDLIAHINGMESLEQLEWRVEQELNKSMVSGIAEAMNRLRPTRRK